jgi:hypothetical protein
MLEEHPAKTAPRNPARMASRRSKSDKADAEYVGDLGPGPLFSWHAAQEMPKPKDWQAFQRGCVILFQQDLKDPHAQGQCPGYFFKEIGKMIGGAVADPISHINVAVEFLRHVWQTQSARPYRQKSTGYLLEQLVRERTHDYARILRTVAGRVRDIQELIDYLTVWVAGHFLPLDR